MGEGCYSTAGLLIILLMTGCRCGASQECSVGQDPGEATLSTVTGHYLNLQHPATCAGNLTTWRYCYYSDSITQTTTYSVIFNVWRPRSDGITFDRIGRTFLNVELSPSGSQGGLLICDTHTETAQVTVQPGDVIGFYSATFPGTPLHITSENAPGFTLNEDTRNDVTALFSSTITRNNTNEVSLGLHLSAEIEVDADMVSPSPSLCCSSTLLTNAKLSPSSMLLSTSAIFMIMLSTNADQSTTPSTSLQVALEETPTSGVLEEKATEIVVTLPGNQRISPAVITIIAVMIVAAALLIALIACVTAVLLWRKGSCRAKQQIERNCIENATYDAPFSTSLDGKESNDSFLDNTVIYDTTMFNDNPPMDMENDPPTYANDGPSLRRETSTDNIHRSQISIYTTLKPSDLIYYNLLREATKEESQKGTIKPFVPPPTQESEIYRELSKLNVRRIPTNFIKVTGHLGVGQFATVHKGTWTEDTLSRQVAVKTLTGKANLQADKVKLLQEAAIMMQFNHPNVVQLHGVVKDQDKVMLVLEYLEEGDLKRYLQDMRQDVQCSTNAATLTCISQLLLNFSQQVALGMYYLSRKGFVHRDLAARNIFVSKDRICKIGDFGMSRDLADADYYVSEGGAIPVRWTALEAVYYRKYSTASDVWSYGCVLYELWSLGYKPFSKLSNAEVIDKVQLGYRLPPPPGCPALIYELMIQCWHPAPSMRPQFSDILTHLLKDESSVLDIPQEDAATHPNASRLGASLEDGEAMYGSMQRSYISCASQREERFMEQSTIYEDMEGHSKKHVYHELNYREIPLDDHDAYLSMSSAT